VGPVRAECLDWTLIFGRRHREQVLTEYVGHYTSARPHRSTSISSRPCRQLKQPAQITRFGASNEPTSLGGLIQEYRHAA
jgi:hypothetical protein